MSRHRIPDRRIARALTVSNGDIRMTAVLLGITPRHLYRLLRQRPRLRVLRQEVRGRLAGTLLSKAGNLALHGGPHGEGDGPMLRFLLSHLDRRFATKLELRSPRHRARVVFCSPEEYRAGRWPPARS